MIQSYKDYLAQQKQAEKTAAESVDSPTEVTDSADETEADEAEAPAPVTKPTRGRSKAQPADA